MQRRKYLENENYERLSDILSDEGNNPYRGRRDNYMFINLLNGNDYDEVSISRWAMEELFLENTTEAELIGPVFITITKLD